MPQTLVRMELGMPDELTDELIITHGRVGDDALVAARGVVDLRTMPRLHAALVQAAAHEAMTVDLAGVELRTPAGVALLLNALRRIDRAGCRLRVASPPGPLRAAMRRTGLARRIHVVDRVEAAEALDVEEDVGAEDAAATAGLRRRRSTIERRSTLLAEATIAIEARYGDPDLGLDEVARRLATSSRQLQRVFAELAGTTFRAELNAVRMQHAAELLLTSDLPVSAIAHRVGHRQPAQFANSFRRHHGLSPTAFRRAAAMGAWGANGR